MVIFLHGAGSNILRQYHPFFGGYGNWGEKVIQTALNQQEIYEYYDRNINTSVFDVPFPLFRGEQYNLVPAHLIEDVIWLYFSPRTTFEAIEKQINDTAQKLPGTIKIQSGTESHFMGQLPHGYNVLTFDYMCTGANHRHLHAILSWNSKKYRKPHRITHDFSALFQKGDIYLNRRERASIKDGTLSITLAPDSACKQAVLGNWGISKVGKSRKFGFSQKG